MIRVYRYRLNPTPTQDRAMREILWRLRELYNATLDERKNAYRLQGVTLSAYGQMREIVEVKVERPEFAAIHAHLLQDVVIRCDRAFKAFFRRVKAGETPGYPRFKGRGQYNTFTYKDAGDGRGAKLVSGGKRVRLYGVGNVKVRLHRPYQGTVKQVSVTMNGDGHWYIAFICADVPVRPLPATGRDVGLDLGLNVFVATSDGEIVENKRFLREAQKGFAKAQRRVSRRKKGSRRRRKAVAILAKRHAKVANSRRNFHHETARRLVVSYDAIYIEDLNVAGLARGMLATSVHDVGWGQFTTILASKAECAGRELVEVNPAGTSQTCAAWRCSCGWAGHPGGQWCPTQGCPVCSGPVTPCDGHVPKDLGVRTHRCPHCGFVEGRDINAALNVQRLGRSRRGGESCRLPDETRSPHHA